MTPSGHVHCGIIEVAWKADCEHVTLKAMPSITQAHIKPNSFEKMKVDLAFQLFGDQVIKGMFLHKEKINSVYRTVQPTEGFLLRFNRFIRVMTSRTSDTALRPKRGNQQFLEEFLNHLDAWEECTKTIGGGFLSESTAAGLRVTVKSTLDLLTYLSTTEGFKYLLTCRLSQDKLENFFGIIRQSAGCNDHPTVSQFSVTVNLVAFYYLAKSPRGGNCASGVVKALLSPASLKSTPPKNLLVSMLEKGRAEEIIDSAVAPNDHSSYTEKRSHSALTYCVAGYVARKTVAKNCCPSCATCLCTTQNEATMDVNCWFTAHFDNGGLVYPSRALSRAILCMEDAFTAFFSKHALHEESLADFGRELCSVDLPKLGCPEHEVATRLSVVKFCFVEN